MSTDDYMQAVQAALDAKAELEALEAELAASSKDDRELKLRVRQARQDFRIHHRHNIPTLPGDAVAKASI